MYVLQTEQRKASQFKTTGGAFRSIEEIYSLAYSIVSPRLPVFSRYLWLQHPHSTFEMVSGANSSAIHGQQFFFLLFPSIMPICAPDKHVKYSRAQCRFRGFGKYLSSKRGASLNTRCQAHSGIKTSEFCYQISQKSVENLVTHSPPFN